MGKLLVTSGEPLYMVESVMMNKLLSPIYVPTREILIFLFQQYVFIFAYTFAGWSQNGEGNWIGEQTGLL